MIWVKSTLSAVALCFAAGMALATEPLSAIPWLSEDAVDLPRPKPRENGTNPPLSVPNIQVEVLPQLELEGIGILPPQSSGLPRDLWRGMSELRTRKLILETPDTGVPASRDLFARMLLAQTLAPAGSAGGDSLLIARIDRLMRKGRLAEADALVTAAGHSSPDLFARRFDIGLLSNKIDAACRELSQQPDYPNFEAARIYCRGTSGGWVAAQNLLDTAIQNGSLTPGMEVLLQLFLDPDASETGEAPQGDRDQSAIEYLIRETLALPRRDGRSKLAFRHLDLSGRAGLRQRILAAEALVIGQAIPANLLFAAYRTGKPAASGGAWDRADAAQKLDKGLATGRWEQPLITLHDRYRRIGLLPAMAQEYASLFSNVTRPKSRDADKALGLTLALSEQHQKNPSSNWSRPVREAHHLAFGTLGTNASALAKAAAAGLQKQLPSTEPANRMRELIDAGKIGAALLRALHLLGAGTGIDPDDLQIALYAISSAGLEDQALKIATQTLVLRSGR